MPSHDLDTLLAWRGSTVRDRDGDKIGTLKELYLDQDDRPAWGAVDTGLFGLRQSFVPLTDATAVDDDVQVPFDKDHVKSAPNVDPDAQLSEDEERRLYRHYELRSAAEEDGEEHGDAEQDERRVAAERAGEPHGDAGRDEGRATAERTGDGDSHGEPPDAMTRSEEEVVVGTRRRVRGKARLRKYVVTEHVQRTIPVQREEVRVEFDQEDGEKEPADDRPGQAG